MNEKKFHEINFLKEDEFKHNYNYNILLNKYSEQSNDLFLVENNNNNSINKIIGILNSEFYLIEKIGNGSTGSVFLSYSINDKKTQKTFYAIKILNISESNSKLINNCKVNYFENMNHKNIVKIYRHGIGILKNDNGNIQQVYYTIMDYLDHGSILSQINGNKGFGEDFGRLIFAQLLDGLETMHNSNIVHRDIKLENIMLSGDDYVLKYVDFEFSKEKSHGFLTSYLGTPNYVAPELLLKKPYLGVYEDIFSLGVSLFIIVTGNLPFSLPLSNDPLYHYILETDYISYWKKRKINVSPSFMELFDNLVAFEPCQRPSISEIKRSKWMKEINWDLFPLLKKEFMKREEIYKQNIKYKKDKPIGKSLENINQINISNIYCQNNNKNIDEFLMKIKGKENEIENEIKKKFCPMNNTIEEDINESTGDGTNNKNKICKNNLMEDSITFKLEIKSLHPIFSVLRRFLIKKGFKPLKNDFKNYIMEITNGEIDINLRLEKNNEDDKYAKISFLGINGDEQEFINFKKLIIQCIQNYDKLSDNSNIDSNSYSKNTKIFNNTKKNIMKGFFYFKKNIKNIRPLIILLKKYFRKYDYISTINDMDNLKLGLSNGEIDITIIFKKEKNDIKLSFDVENVTQNEFINIKKLISQFIQKLE